MVLRSNTKSNLRKEEAMDISAERKGVAGEQGK
jgi:hypothetical protein